jgi:hypothetical protein
MIVHHTHDRNSRTSNLRISALTFSSVLLNGSSHYPSSFHHPADHYGHLTQVTVSRNLLLYTITLGKSIAADCFNFRLPFE